MDLIEDESRWERYLHRHGYNLCHHIGCGSFGDVFSVTKLSPLTTRDGEDVIVNYAVKRLVTWSNILEDEYAMMEIQSLLQLQHENIIPVLEVFLSKKVACIVMELAPLGNLEMFVKNSDSLAITESFIANSFGQILSAVEYCHSYFLAHRDVNPSNVLMFNGLLVKLADFGLCFQCKNEEDGKMIRCLDYLGHDNYLAPEVKKCTPYHAMPADVWSLGCVLRYLATKSGHYICREDPPTCNNKCDYKNYRQCLHDLNGNNKNLNDPKTNTKSEMLFPLQQSIPEEKTFAMMISWFVNHLCQNSPRDRPSANEALLCWKKDFVFMNGYQNTIKKAHIMESREMEE